MSGILDDLDLGNPLLRWGVAPDDLAPLASGQVYLATPYTLQAAPDGVFDADAAAAAMAEAALVMMVLALTGVSAVSPIVLAHVGCGEMFETMGAAWAEGLALDGAFWQRWRRPLLLASRLVYVPAIDGWRASAGIRREVLSSLAEGRRVIFEHPLTQGGTP